MAWRHPDSTLSHSKPMRCGEYDASMWSWAARIRSGIAPPFATVHAMPSAGSAPSHAQSLNSKYEGIGWATTNRPAHNDSMMRFGLFASVHLASGIAGMRTKSVAARELAVSLIDHSAYLKDKRCRYLPLNSLQARSSPG